MALEERILKVLKETFELYTVDSTCNQESCEKWDSMGQLNLAVELETEFNITLEPEEIGAMKSFEDIVEIIIKKM